MLAAAYAAAVAGLPTSVRPTFDRAASNRLRDLPSEYLVLDRSESQWQALRKALRHVATCQKLSVAPAAHFAQLIADTNSEPSVIAAKSALALNQLAIKQSLQSALD